MSQASRAARTETAQSLGRPTMLQCILHANPPVIKCQWWVNRSNRSYCQHIPIGFHLPSILESESHCVQLPVIGQWNLTIFPSLSSLIGHFQTGVHFAGGFQTPNFVLIPLCHFADTARLAFGTCKCMFP
jgi:hypothetical protein